MATDQEKSHGRDITCSATIRWPGSQQPQGALLLELLDQGEPGGLASHCGVEELIHGQRRRLKILVGPVCGNQHGPQGGCHTTQITGDMNLLMADPFGPGHGGGASENMHGLVAGLIPTASGLAGTRPEERIAAIADAKAQA